MGGPAVKTGLPVGGGVTLQPEVMTVPAFDGGGVMGGPAVKTNLPVGGGVESIMQKMLGCPCTTNFS